MSDGRLGHTLDSAVYGRHMATTQTCPFGPGFDFTNPDILEKGIPVTEFAELRKTAPVWWNEQPSRSSTTAATG